MKRISLADRHKAVADCRSTIIGGGVAAFPTEAFYGLGVRYDDSRALERLYILKKRPKDKAIPLIIGERSLLTLIAETPGLLAERLMDRFWPGPLTLLIRARSDLHELIAAGGKVAVRIPGSSFALELVRSLPFPVTATSANLSGMPPAVHPDELVACFGQALDIIVDGGETPGGRPSTIVDVKDDALEIVRTGAVPVEEILQVARSFKR